MLSPKENFLETIKKDGHPDRIVKQYESLVFLPGDPVCTYVRGKRFPGMEPAKDLWGTTIVWPEDSIGAMPHITPDNRAITDITEWKNEIKIPDLAANCSDEALWKPYLERLNAVDRDKQLTMMFAPTGLFERLHFIQGFEDALINLIEEPEATKELCDAIGEYRYIGLKLMCDYAKPDAIISHDDWGSKTNLFMSPDMWREYIKPWYKKAYDYMHEKGVLVIHHADSFLEPIVEDMIEIGVDVWQGVLPQNDIVKLQKQIDGRMALMGGIDSGIVDKPDSTEEEIRTETRRVLNTYCPQGNFIPCITYGAPGTVYPKADELINDEIDRYNKEHFQL